MMKSNLWGVLALVAIATAGCKEVKIGEFVEQSIELKADKDNASKLSGELKFFHNETETHYRTVCETYICGYDHRRVCHERPRECHETGRSCRTVRKCPDRPGAACRDEEVCTGGRTVCTGGGTVCHDESYPRYCQRDCRQVPYTEVVTYTTKSAVNLEVEGFTPTNKKQKIDEIQLAIHTNDKYRTALKDPSKLPDQLKGIADDVKPNDNTLLILKAKGFELEKDQAWLTLPDGFKRGDTLNLKVKVRTSTSDDARVSALGSETNLPSIWF